MSFLADALNVPVTSLIVGEDSAAPATPATPPPKCVFCRQRNPAPGDNFYCLDCRHMIQRELSDYQEARRAADITVLRGHAIAAALAKAQPEPAASDAFEAWRQCCRQVSEVLCNDYFSISRFYDLCGLRD